MNDVQLRVAVATFREMVTTSRQAEQMGRLLGASITTTESAEDMLTVAVNATDEHGWWGYWPPFRTGWNSAVAEPHLHSISTPWPDRDDIAGAMGDRTTRHASVEAIESALQGEKPRGWDKV